jgi:hypothetical protein
MFHKSIEARVRRWTPLEAAKFCAAIIIGVPLLAVLGLMAVWFGGF